MRAALRGPCYPTGAVGGSVFAHHLRSVDGKTCERCGLSWERERPKVTPAVLRCWCYQCAGRIVWSTPEAYIEHREALAVQLTMFPDLAPEVIPEIEHPTLTLVTNEATP